MEKILVRWCDGRSIGTTSLVKNTAEWTGMITLGNKVTVKVGKDKENMAGRSDWYQHVPAPPAVSRIEQEAEPFTSKLAAPAPQPSRVREVPSMPLENSQPHHQHLPAIMEKLDVLSDAVTSVEGQLLHHINTLEEKVTEMKNNVKKSAPVA